MRPLSSPFAFFYLFFWKAFVYKGRFLDIMYITDIDGIKYKITLNIGVFLDILLEKDIDFFNPLKKNKEGFSALDFLETPKGLRLVLYYVCNVDESDKLLFFQKLPLDILKKIYPRLLTALVFFYSGGGKKKNEGNISDCQEAFSEKTAKYISLEDIFALINAANAGAFYKTLQFWELQALAIAKLKQDANERASILCTIWNAHARKRSQIKEPSDFNPFVIAEKKEQIDRLKRKYKAKQSLSEFIKENQGGV